MCEAPELIIQETPPTQTLCLNMIVKDEAHIIQDTLRLLVDRFPITYWVIDDTGSTDGTQDIIREFFSSRGISGELYETPWRDFGHNRTEAFNHAYDKTDYVLVWDADDSIEGKISLPKPLTADSYTLTFGTPCGVRYVRPLIFNNRKHWKYVGVLHEYSECCEAAGPAVNITGDYYLISGRSGARSKDPLKYVKDAQVLERAILEEPRNERYVFYCANSYKDAGDLDNALKWYVRCIEMGGWAQERFIAALEIGHIYRKKGDMPNAIFWWMKGYQICPQRAETLYEITKHYRETGNCHQAQIFYDMATSIPYPGDNALFIQRKVYDTLLFYEYSIIACYTKRPMDHYRYLELLSSGHATDNVLSNYKFYAQKLADQPDVKIHDFSERVEKVVSGRADTFTSSSPCIIPHGDGYMLNVRYVNYNINLGAGGTYEFRNGSDKIITLNKLYWLNRDFEVCGEPHWFDHVTNYDTQYSGVEDVRLFQHRGDIHFIGVMQAPNTGRITVGHGIYDIRANALTQHAFPSPMGRDCEKNWCYFHDKKGELCVVYQWSPLTIGKPALEDHELSLQTLDLSVPGFFSRLRGSTCGARFGDEIWFLCHIVEYAAPRHYTHIIVVLDANTLRYKRHSIMFKFSGDCIEYALGLIVEHDRLIMSYSRVDRTSAVIVVPRAIADTMLFPKKA
jgi:glycosyltransferase involved in cell wall biosynthesis